MSILAGSDEYFSVKITKHEAGAFCKTITVTSNNLSNRKIKEYSYEQYSIPVINLLVVLLPCNNWLLDPNLKIK